MAVTIYSDLLFWSIIDNVYESDFIPLTGLWYLRPLAGLIVTVSPLTGL